MENNLHNKTIAFCTTIIAAICAIFWDKIIFVVPVFILFVALAVYKKYFSKVFLAILSVIFALSIFYAHIRQPVPDILYFLNGKNITMDGIVLSLPDTTNSHKIRFAFKVNSIVDEDGIIRPINAKTQVFLNQNINTKVLRGDSLQLQANIVVPKYFSNPGEFDYGKYLANSDIYTLSFADSITFKGKEPGFKTKILTVIDKIREKVVAEHSKYLNKEKTEILSGVVFGSEAIKPSPELKNTFIESGLYHLLAASGMNVAFIFGIWFFIFIKLKTPYRFVIVSGGIIVFFYALMTGLPPSVTRATWMLELALLAKLLDRKADNNVILLFVCALLLLYNPKYINDIGFLLSFVVTFGLLALSNPILEKIKFVPPRVSGWVIIPVIAQISAIPIQMYYFQTISIYSVLANVLVIPFMAIISFCGFVSSILSLIPKVGSAICFLLDKLNEPFLTFMLFVAEKISELPNNIAHVAKLNSFEITLYYILLILFVYMLKKNFKDIRANITAGIIVILLVFSLISKGYCRDLTFTFLNVGEADSIFITTPNNKKILVDAGKFYGRNRNSATSVILPFLKQQGITCLDMMLLTHPDSDHIGGSVDILKNITVKTLITNGEEAQSKSFNNLKNYIASSGKDVVVIDKLMEISPDKDVSIIAIKPADTNEKSKNDTSIILLIKYKDFDGILMGDNEVNSYEDLKKNINPTGEIEMFKVGHHGSYKSVNFDMAKLISPNVSVISVGENSYGHPHPRVFSALRGSRIYRTDIDNTVKIKTNGKNFDVYTYNPQKSCWKKDNRKP